MDKELAVEIRDLEEVVAVLSDEELEDLLLEKYAEREEELARAAAVRSRRWFELEQLSSAECSQLFRFSKEDLRELRVRLRLPAVMTAPNRTTWSGLEGLCLTLRRLSYPSRRCDLEQLFGRGVAEASIIFNSTLDHMYQEWNRLFIDLNEHTGSWLSPQRMEECCRAVHDMGSPLDNIFGFIDGTARPICRPKTHQRLWYSGHKRRHVMKFQSVMSPAGIILHLFGPVEGRRHDASMLDTSGLLPQLDQLNRPAHLGGGPYAVYGDPAYPLRTHLLCPFADPDTPEQQHFNKAMSEVRIAVEWGFGGVLQQFAFLQHKENNKIGLQPVAQYYTVSTLLFNCMACFYRNEVSHFFGVHPPSIEEYLHHP